MSNSKYVQASHPITKDEIGALRDANRMYARVNEEGACTLEAIERLTRHGHDTEITTDVECGWSIVDYEKEGNTPIDRAVVEWRYTCFVSVWHPTMQTVAQYILKPGDLLVLHWIRCNYSETAEKHNVTQDEMELHILRGDPASGKRKKLVFRLASELVFLDAYQGTRPVRRELHAKTPPVYSLVTN
jgi:hypothetical protein